jgi:hypothetical protein
LVFYLGRSNLKRLTGSPALAFEEVDVMAILIRHMLLAGLAVMGSIELAGPASAQSSDAIARRLDALEKDNAALRERMRQMEGREKETEKKIETSMPNRAEFVDATPPVTVDVTKYIPTSAVSVTVLVSVTPPTGTALVYTEGNETAPIVFRGPQAINEIRLAGPFIYVRLVEATSFDIRYMNYREP